MVARRLNKIRSSGKVYRYGGAEFAMVFAGKQLLDASYFLEEVRKSIQGYEMIIRQKHRTDADISDHSARTRGSYRAATEKVSVNISIGVAEKSRRTDTAEAALKEADAALYKAKKSGRNQLQESRN
jgi:PleD family two-component response regulator